MIRLSVYLKIAFWNTTHKLATMAAITDAKQ